MTYDQITKTIDLITNGSYLPYSDAETWTDQEWHDLRNRLHREGYYLTDNSDGFEGVPIEVEE